MASNLNFVQFLGDQLQTLAPVTWRKMFGEFALYHHGKVVAFVCDNQVWLKPTPQAEQIVPRVIGGHAYPGPSGHATGQSLRQPVAPVTNRLLDAHAPAHPAQVQSLG